MRKEPSTEAKFAFIFGLAILSVMLCWFPVEPVSAGGPEPDYVQRGEPTTLGETTLTGDIKLGTNQLRFRSVDDLFYSDGANSIVLRTNTIDRVWWGNSQMRLGTDSATYDLKITGSVYASMPFVVAESAGAVSVGNATFATATYATEVTDTHNAWDTTASKFVAPIAGEYMVTARTYWAASGAGTARVMGIYIDGAFGTPRHSMTRDTPAAQEFNSAISAVVSLAANETMSIVLFQDSGGALNAGGANNGSVITIKCLNATE